MPNNPRRITALFAAATALSAFLLFQIQPLISKAILAWFGGGSAVWSAAMLFFQAALLGGYTYAYLLGRLEPRRQARLHLLVLAGAAVYLLAMAALRRAPILPGDALQPAPGGNPAAQVLGVLALTAGLPYLLLATTSTLAQAWFARLTGGQQPYWLYALSNAASLLGLASYPLLFEPLWTVTAQARFWSAGFAIYLALAAALALRVLRSAPTRASVPAQAPPDPGDLPAAAPTFRAVLGWLVPAAVASLLLLAVTNQISQDVPSVPFLWVLPLSIYLLTFIAAFSGRLAYRPLPYALVTLAAVWLGLATLTLAPRLTIGQLIFVNSVLLAVACLFCHAALYAARPHPRHLAAFYLAVSAGGALGGLIVSGLAPLLFPDYWEYPLGLVAAALLALAALFRAAPVDCAAPEGRAAPKARLGWLLLRGAAALATAVLAFLLAQNSWEWFDQSVMMSRSFYGVLRVRRMDYEGVMTYNLVHGRIIHGTQALGGTYRRQPTRYYSPSTGIGLAFNFHARRAEGLPLRAGMVGLGAGTVAAYGQPGDTIRFYEIDPHVIEIARDPAYFTYLMDSPAEIEVVLGDARLSLERALREGAPGAFDILAIDAFSGDSVPTHLIDREAVALYLRHLAPGGILAFHVSNRHLDLEPVVAALADELFLTCYTFHGGADDWLGSNATWVLLSRDPSAFDTPALALARLPTRRLPGLRPWTDDYSNLLQVLR